MLPTLEAYFNNSNAQFDDATCRGCGRDPNMPALTALITDPGHLLWFRLQNVGCTCAQTQNQVESDPVFNGRYTSLQFHETLHSWTLIGDLYLVRDMSFDPERAREFSQEQL